MTGSQHSYVIVIIILNVDNVLSPRYLFAYGTPYIFKFVYESLPSLDLFCVFLASVVYPGDHTIPFQHLCHQLSLGTEYTLGDFTWEEPVSSSELPGIHIALREHEEALSY